MQLEVTAHMRKRAAGETSIAFRRIALLESGRRNGIRKVLCWQYVWQQDVKAHPLSSTPCLALLLLHYYRQAGSLSLVSHCTFDYIIFLPKNLKTLRCRLENMERRIEHSSLVVSFDKDREVLPKVDPTWIAWTARAQGGLCIRRGPGHVVRHT